ncbi:MAG: LEPR-XLL domain-containing protein, partial [Alphaproteobacteria bacterium]|nr:LEPR-XLL domain-containing protein [Alphaproteobacteria bacterium]
MRRSGSRGSPRSERRYLRASYRQAFGKLVGRTSPDSAPVALTSSPTPARRRNWLDSTTLSRRVHFESLEPRILLSSDLTPISGSIDVQGESDRY